mmetsp:Transcript_28925/g.84011  ORF Transcript_28925/g.84011 Transcript_28925/m.84011 type:complete len:213 (-) Transcript_28925:2097-2735(-)
MHNTNVVDGLRKWGVVGTMDFLPHINDVGECTDCLFEISRRTKAHAHLIQRRCNAVLEDTELWVAIAPSHARFVPQLGSDIEDSKLHMDDRDVVHDRSRQLILYSLVGKCIGAVLALGDNRHEARHGSIIISKLQLVEGNFLRDDNLGKDVIQMIQRIGLIFPCRMMAKLLAKAYKINTSLSANFRLLGSNGITERGADNDIRINSRLNAGR